MKRDRKDLRQSKRLRRDGQRTLWAAIRKQQAIIMVAILNKVVEDYLLKLPIDGSSKDMIKIYFNNEKIKTATAFAESFADILSPKPSRTP